MRVPTHADAFQVLLLQAADEGRGAVLFGESQSRAREFVPPFLIGDKFPSVYLEHPLIGQPFLDVTVLFSELQKGTRVPSAAAGDHGAIIDWFADIWPQHPNISFGFELDTKEDTLPTAAVHFQPRMHTHLARGFCEAVGEPERAQLYIDLAARMPDSWPLSFFGMFRGRAGSPLRVCGYLDKGEQASCAQSRSRLARVFDEIGFEAYDDAMLSQVTELMKAAPTTVDFQFDVHPDGHLGSTFAIDMQFGIEQPEGVRKTFGNGPGARVMGMLEDWGAADGRWKLGAQAAFARALPIELPDGGIGRFGFTLMPQWVKARWTDGKLQPSKLYHLANASLFESKPEHKS